MLELGEDVPGAAAVALGCLLDALSATVQRVTDRLDGLEPVPSLRTHRGLSDAATAAPVNPFIAMIPVVAPWGWWFLSRIDKTRLK